jgi:hypothetical protein
MNGSNTYAVRIQGGIATVEWFGIPSFKEISRVMNGVIHHKDYRKGMALLFVDRAERFAPAPRMIEIGIRRIALYAKHFDRHMAFVFERETHFEVGRVCAMFAESRGIVLMPFREVNAARQWLVAQMSDSNSYPASAD